MPVDQLHPQYVQHEDQFIRTEDAYNGQDAVKAQTTRYVPLIEGWDGATDPKYQRYLKRGLWYAATRRTVIGLLGAVFRKDPENSNMEGGRWPEYLRDITLTGMSYSAFQWLMFRNVLAPGRYGILVDRPDKPATGSLPAKLDRPKLCGYSARRIRYWETVQVGAETQLGLVILEEDETVPDPDKIEDDPFARITRKRYRVLKLEVDTVDGEQKGRYTVQLWWKEENDWAHGPIRTPLKRGQPLDFIPFAFVNPYDTEPDVDESPVLGLVDLNYDHFRLDCDLKNALHVAGIPTPWFAGFEFPQTDSENDGDETDMIALGSEWGLVAKDPQAKAAFLEYEGKGLGEITGEKKSDEERMAAMGARLLEQPKSVGEAAMAIQFRHAGEHSALGAIAQTASEALTVVMQWFADWADVTTWMDVATALNKDYFAGKMPPEQLNAIVKAWQGGFFDHETALWNAEQGELLQPGETPEDVMGRLAMEGPATPDITDDEEDEDEEGSLVEGNPEDNFSGGDE